MIQWLLQVPDTEGEAVTLVAGPITINEIPGVRLDSVEKRPTFPIQSIPSVSSLDPHIP